MDAERGESSGVYFEDVTVGMQVTPFERDTHFEEWNRYAAVNDEFVSFHMDDSAGRAAGNERGSFGMGNLRLSYLVNMILGWAGDHAEVRRLSVQYRQLNQQHDHLLCIGEVVGKDVVNGEHLVELRVDVLNQENMGTTPGSATLVLPSRGAGHG